VCHHPRQGPPVPHLGAARTLRTSSDRLNPQEVQQQLSNQKSSCNLLVSFGNVLGAFFTFAKLPSPIQKILVDLRITDGLDVDMLLKFLRVLVRLRVLAGRTQTPASQTLQVLYDFTTVALATKTVAATDRGDTRINIIATYWLFSFLHAPCCLCCNQNILGRRGLANFYLRMLGTSSK
jgi:hypothetical protein